jgi:hypothetical protein
MVSALSTPYWGGPSPLAPQARSVHGLRRHVEYPTVVDMVIETNNSTTKTL